MESPLDRLEREFHEYNRLHHTTRAIGDVVSHNDQRMIVIAAKKVKGEWEYDLVPYIQPITSVSQYDLENAPSDGIVLTVDDLSPFRRMEEVNAACRRSGASLKIECDSGLYEMKITKKNGDVVKFTGSTLDELLENASAGIWLFV